MARTTSAQVLTQGAGQLLLSVAPPHLQFRQRDPIDLRSSAQYRKFLNEARPRKHERARETICFSFRRFVACSPAHVADEVPTLMGVPEAHPARGSIVAISHNDRPRRRDGKRIYLTLICIEHCYHGAGILKHTNHVPDRTTAQSPMDPAFFCRSLGCLRTVDWKLRKIELGKLKPRIDCAYKSAEKLAFGESSTILLNKYSYLLWPAFS